MTTIEHHPTPTTFDPWTRPSWATTTTTYPGDAGEPATPCHARGVYATDGFDISVTQYDAEPPNVYLIEWTDLAFTNPRDVLELAAKLSEAAGILRQARSEWLRAQRQAAS